jgi:hypothetical protein
MDSKNIRSLGRNSEKEILKNSAVISENKTGLTGIKLYSVSKAHALAIFIYSASSHQIV